MTFDLKINVFHFSSRVCFRDEGKENTIWRENFKEERSLYLRTLTLAKDKCM